MLEMKKPGWLVQALRSFLFLSDDFNIPLSPILNFLVVFRNFDITFHRNIIQQICIKIIHLRLLFRDVFRGIIP